MRTINRKAIIGYLQETLADLDLFSEVSWLCVGDNITCEHHRQSSDQSAQAFVHMFVRKADGNFLWTSLMANAVRDKLDGGFNLAHVERLIRDTTGGLEGYIQKLIYERINKSFKSETAMALIIASYGIEHWVAFWLLFASINGKTPSWENPNHALTMPYHSLNGHTLEGMRQDTLKFLRTCCRDILTLSGEPDARLLWMPFRGQKVTFARRTMHDSVHTEAIQALLYEHSPPSFSHVNFIVNLGIASAKVIIAGTAIPSEDFEARNLSLFHALYAILVAIEKRHQKARYIVTVRPGSTIPLKVVEEIEKVVMHHLLEKGATNKPGGEVLLNQTDVPGHKWMGHMKSISRIMSRLRILCCFLAGYGLFTLTDTILREWPNLIMYYSEPLKENYLLSFSLGMDHQGYGGARPMRIQAPWKAANVLLLQRLLEAGADPNAEITVEPLSSAEHQWSTPWCMFLGRLVESEKSPVTVDAGTNASARAAMQKRASSPSSVEPSSCSDTKLALKMLLQYGAEIRLSSNAGAVFDLMGMPYVDGRIEPLEALRKLLTSEELSKLGLNTV